MLKNILILASLVVVAAGCASTVQKSDQSAPIPVGAQAGKSIVLNMTGSTVATTAKDWSDFRVYGAMPARRNLPRSAPSS